PRLCPQRVSSGFVLLPWAWRGELSAARPQAQSGEPQTAETGVLSAPVVIDGRTLYSVRGVSAFPAEKRAEIIRTRILELARDPAFDPATIEIAETDTYVLIGPPSRPIQRITEADAEFEGSDRHVLADVYRARMR